jgi:hypothetical protein
LERLGAPKSPKSNFFIQCDKKNNFNSIIIVRISKVKLKKGEIINYFISIQLLGLEQR